MVGNGLVPYDDLYHEYPERHEQMKYMAAAPNKECESVTFDSALSFGKMYVDPLASVYPSQLKKDSPQSDIKKQTFVPVRLRSRGGRCARGRGRGHGRVLVGFSVRACSFCYTLVIGGRGKQQRSNLFLLSRGDSARGFYEQDCRIAFTRAVHRHTPGEMRLITKFRTPRGQQQSLERQREKKRAATRQHRTGLPKSAGRIKSRGAIQARLPTAARV